MLYEWRVLLFTIHYYSTPYNLVVAKERDGKAAADDYTIIRTFFREYLSHGATIYRGKSLCFEVVLEQSSENTQDTYV